MSDPNTESSHLPPLWPFALLCAGIAGTISLGEIQRYHNSDSLVPVLESLYCWKPYFWIQNRFGMLVPLLAVPVKSPLANLLCQSFLYLFTGLMALFLLARYLLRNHAYPFPAALAAAGMLFLAPTWFPWSFFLGAFSGVWLFLGCAGLVLLEPRSGGAIPWYRQSLALLSLVLAHWVYLPTALLFGPLVVARWVFCDLFSSSHGDRTVVLADRGSGRPDRDWLRQVVRGEVVVSLFHLAVGLAVGFTMMKLTPAPEDPLRLGAVPMSKWFAAWSLLAHNLGAVLAACPGPISLVLLFGFGTLWWLIPVVRARTSSSWRAALALLAAALLYQLFMGTRDWVYAGGRGGVRYCYPGGFFIQAALAIVALTPLCPALPGRARTWLYWAGAPAMLLAAVHTYGMPSLTGVRARVGQIHRFGVDTSEVLAARCTHVAGDYWKVWTVVFHANQIRHEHGEAPLWGITARSTPTQQLWSKVPREEMLVAVPVGDEKLADFYFRHYRLPEMEVVEKLRSVTLWRPRGVSRP